MAAIKSCGNISTETALLRILRKKKITGWRRNYKKITGTPDFAFPKLKIAVFVDGCFWHGCPKCVLTPKTNRYFWKNKIGQNKKRDQRVNKELRKKKWRVLRFWEHQIKKGIDKVASKIELEKRL